jgi:hypothetical protein
MENERAGSIAIRRVAVDNRGALRSVGRATADLAETVERNGDGAGDSYAFGTGALDRLEVTVGPFGLMIGRPEGTARGLSHLGDHAFHPAGAPSVRVRFEVPADAGEPASGVTIHDAELIVRAVRR